MTAAPDSPHWDSAGRPKKPAIIGIGAQKAGTTWLAAMLAQNPGAWAPPLKEAQFFTHIYAPEHRDWLPWHFRRGRQNLEKRHAARGEPLPPHLADWFDRITRGEMFTNHWYKTLFAPAPEGTLPVDISPEYSTISAEGVAAAASFLPKARFIYILRHPVDRAISQLKMNLTRKGRRPATEAAWMAEIDDPVLLNRGDYASYVPRWDAVLGADRLLYLPFGDIARAPIETLRRVETFCGLPEHAYQGADRKVFASTDALTVPDAARAALRARLEPQFAFLEARFPAEFVARLR